MVLLAKFFYFVRPVAKNLKKKKKERRNLVGSLIKWISHLTLGLCSLVNGWGTMMELVVVVVAVVWRIL